MSYIQLTQGQKTRVDNVDFVRLNQYKWCAAYWPAKNRLAAIRGVWNRKRNRVITIYMHREILGLKHGDRAHVDHINHDVLDNRRSNLRICTNIENHQNERKHRMSRSKYKGVCFYNNGWVARITHQNKRHYLGCFTTQKEAARVYDAAARIFFGEFACVNFPDKGEQHAAWL